MINKLLKWLFIVLAGIALLLLAAAHAYRDIPAAELEAKYATPPSKFIEVDGVRVHYRDEGSGPAVVLIHAHYASLFMWEPWAAALRDPYRVVRFDMTSHGLTGPDPSGDYSLPRTVALFEQFADQLGLDRFALAGTSLGGTVAMHYTARHPDRVERLILISPGALNTRVRGQSKPPEIPRVFDLLTIVTPRWLASYMLKSSFGDPEKVDDRLIDEWWEMWLREGNRPAEFARMRQYVSGDIESVIRAIRVPVLVMWGEKNPRVTIDQADELRRLLVDAPEVRIEVLPGIGHMAVQEDAALTGRLARAFLDAPAAAD